VKAKVFNQQKTAAQKAKEEKAKQIEREEKARQDELNKILRASVLQQKVQAGADPKSVVCEYFKRGLCTKGDKCKFSHDLSLGRKAAKKSVYAPGSEEGFLSPFSVFFTPISREKRRYHGQMGSGDARKGR
jgi:hypothetical protein